MVKSKDKYLFYTKNRGCDAKDFYHESDFTLLKGSILLKDIVPSFAANK